MTTSQIFFYCVFGALLIEAVRQLWNSISAYYFWKNYVPHNFPFVHHKRTLWYSRSVAVVGIVFALDSNNRMCVLVNQRGLGTPDFQGYWNAPCGYLDFNETLSEAAEREVFEETGVRAKFSNKNIMKIISDPSSNKQNVSITFATILPVKCEDTQTTTQFSEFEEVAEIKWLPVSEVNSLPWAFGHDTRIKEAYNALT